MMPVTERFAIPILKREGFTKIYWESLVRWESPFDFRAVRNGKEYLIEVKSDVWHMTQNKLLRLRKLGRSVLILLVTSKGPYYCVPLEDFVDFSQKVLPKSKGRIDHKGRVVIPKIIRWRLNLVKDIAFKIINVTQNKLLLQPELDRSLCQK